MSETTEQGPPEDAPPPPPPPPTPPTNPPNPTDPEPPHYFRRSSSDRWLGGVAAGLAGYFGVDPVLARVGVVVFAFINPPVAIVMYVLGLMFVPADGELGSATPRFVDRHSKVLSVIAGAAVVLTLLGGFVGNWGFHMGWGPTLVIVILAVTAFVRGRRQRAEMPHTYSSTYSSAYGDTSEQFTSEPVASEQFTSEPVASQQFTSEPFVAAPFAAAPFVSAPPPSSPPIPPSLIPPTPYPTAAYAAAPYPQLDAQWQPRERSALGPFTVGAALVTAGVLVTLDRANVVSVPTVVVLASALAVVGLGLVVGAVAGRSRGLIALGVVLSVVTAIAGVVHVPASTSIGDQTWTPVSAAAVAPSYTWGIGDTKLDLSSISSPTPVSTSVELGVGQIVVTVPRAAVVRLHAKVGVGAIDTVDIGGLTTTVGGVSREVTTTLAPSTPVPGATTFNLDVSVGIGHVEVNRA